MCERDKTDYSIREISEMFDLPASTLRYYEELGLLPEVERNKAGQRVYTKAHIDRLRAICCFKNTGLSIAGIAEFFRYEADVPGNIDEILALLEEHEQGLKMRIRSLQKDLLHIQQKVHYYSGIKDAIQENQPWPRWCDYLEVTEINKV